MSGNEVMSMQNYPTLGVIPTHTLKKYICGREKFMRKVHVSWANSIRAEYVRMIEAT